MKPPEVKVEKLKTRQGQLDKIKKAKEEEIKAFYLSPVHLKYGKELIKSHILPRFRKKRKCDRCKGDGLAGLDKHNCAIGCIRCVNTYVAFKEWIEYCKKFPELTEFFIEEE